MYAFVSRLICTSDRAVCGQVESFAVVYDGISPIESMRKEEQYFLTLILPPPLPAAPALKEESRVGVVIGRLHNGLWDVR